MKILLKTAFIGWKIDFLNCPLNFFQMFRQQKVPEKKRHVVESTTADREIK